jgi:hypothetical protein
MANITTLSSIIVATTIKGTEHEEKNFHLDIIDPDNKHNWKEGNDIPANDEVGFTLIKNIDEGTTYVSTEVDLTSYGRWRVIMYKGTPGGDYTKIGSASIRKISIPTHVYI